LLEVGQLLAALTDELSCLLTSGIALLLLLLLLLLLQFSVRLIMYYTAAASGDATADFYSTVSYYLIR
jgi:hypothetical protein